MTNNAETIRGRCKTETNIDLRREAGRAKIDGVDEGNEAEGAGAREESDEWEEFGNRKVMRKHDPRQSAGEGGPRDDASPISQFVQALRHGERTRRRLSQNDGRRETSSGSALGLHFHGRREGREDVGALGCERKRDKGCAVVPRKTTGEWICRAARSLSFWRTPPLHTFSTSAQYIHSCADLIDFQPFSRLRKNRNFMCQHARLQCCTSVFEELDARIGGFSFLTQDPEI